MSVETNELRRSTLQRKDRDELIAIATALGTPPSSRARKAEIVELILDTASDDEPTEETDADGAGEATEKKPARSAKAAKASTEDADEADDDESSDSGEIDDDESEDDDDRDSGDDDSGDDDSDDDDAASGGRAKGNNRKAKPKADSAGNGDAPSGRRQGRDSGSGDGQAGRGSANATDDDKGDDDEDAAGNRRRRRRGRDRERNDDQYSGDPVPVAGHLDLRDEGYGFLRTSGFRPSRDDAYVSVRQVRQFGLRRGDLLVGGCRPAARNEKNPALVHIDSVNGADPETAPQRPQFDEIPATHPFERLTLESADDPTNLVARLVDLAAPPGKGQRGLIEVGPRTDATSLLRDLARAVEANHPDAVVIMALLDERPENIGEFSEALDRSEVQASTFDRPADDHIQLAELTVERAKRLSEAGTDVVLLVDGLTQLARAYNMAGPSAGRTVAGIDSGAIYMTKRFFGAARKLEGAGSLTILATADTGNSSRVDEVVYEELRSAANWVVRLDTSLAAHRVTPAIDVGSSATSREELLVDDEALTRLHTLRRLLADAAPAGDATAMAAATERLLEELANHPTNAALLDAVAAGKVSFA